MRVYDELENVYNVNTRFKRVYLVFNTFHGMVLEALVSIWIEGNIQEFSFLLYHF